MSLTRRMLTAMGIEPEKIDEIITAHAETVDALKADRDKYKEDAAKLDSVQKELDDLKEAKGKNDSYKEKYEKEHADFEKYKGEQTAKETKAKKTEAYRALLKEAGISEKHMNAVLRVSDVDSIELDDNGKVKDSQQTVDAIKKDWSDFIVSNGTQGAHTATPPQGNGDNKYHGTGRAAKIAAAYHNNLYGNSNDNNGSNNGGEQ